MKKTLIALGIIGVITLGGCSSTKQSNVGTGGSIPAGQQQAISEQRLASDFKRQGVRVIYSTFGNLEAIETTGYAPVWGSSQNAAREAYRAAELEAKKALNDFINKEQIRSTVSLNMISRNLEKARDNKVNNFATNRNRDQVTALTDDDEAGGTNNQQNTATRDDALSIASRVNTNITIRSQGILNGLRLVEGEAINDGRTVRVVYRWDARNDETIKNVRRIMAQ